MVTTQRWEHLIVDLNSLIKQRQAMALSDGDPDDSYTITQEVLDNYGYKGWDLCSVNIIEIPDAPHTFLATAFFKRPVAS